MYGLVIESIVAFIRKTYGDDKWMEIRKLGKIEQHSFSTHLIYPETTIPRLVETASELLGISREDFLTHLGRFFVTFVSQYGYDKILRVLGRHMRDFLNGLDNLHEYMRFSYPKLRPPSFFVEKETEHGLMLHYRSKRRYGGYVRYVMGQIKSVGETFYGLDIDIEVLREEFVGNMVHVTMQLRFDNSAFLTEKTASQDILDDMRIESDLFFEAFPFHIVFTEDLIVKSAGLGLANVMPNIEGHDISHIFILRRPMVEFAWEQILSHTNNVFELESVDMLQKKEDNGFSHDYSDDDNTHKLSFESQSDVSDATPMEGMKLHLKGQMIWTPEWQAILFLGTPVLPHLTAMFDTGLFINDLSLHDNSRDLVLAGTQTSAELKLALDQEQVKSKKLEDNMKKLDEEMRRTDELLYQMIPRQIADRLRAGEPALDTCQVFDHVTILFSDVVGFTMICSRISPLQVVNMLNSMYSKFDHLCSVHEIYKVETIGDAYVVVSGAPEEVDDHAERIADMALGMIDTMQSLVDPSTGNHLQIRVGLNSGVVVAGVVGLKMPRYCLFGDTVNTAAKMESSSEHMRIQMTQSTMSFLKDNPNYVVTERGLVDIKDKGKMYTYWLAASESYQSRVSNNELKLTQAPKNPSKMPNKFRNEGSFESPTFNGRVTPPYVIKPYQVNGGSLNPATQGSDTLATSSATLNGTDLPPRKASEELIKNRKFSSPTPVLIYDSKQNSRHSARPEPPSGAGKVAPMFKSVRTSPRHAPLPTEEPSKSKRSVEVSSPDSLTQQPASKKPMPLLPQNPPDMMPIPPQSPPEAMSPKSPFSIPGIMPNGGPLKRELSSPFQPPAQRAVDLKPSVTVEDSSKKLPKIGISPFDTSSSEYEGGDAGGASDSDSFSRSDSIESFGSRRRRSSRHKVASSSDNRQPIFTIRPEDHVVQKEPAFVAVAKRPAKTDMSKEAIAMEQQQKLLFAKMLAAKMAPVHIPTLNRRLSQDVVRRTSRDSSSTRISVPVISVSSGGTNSAGTEERSDKRRGSNSVNGTGEHELPRKTAVAAMPGTPTKPTQTNSTRRKIAHELQQPKKSAEVVIAAATPSIDSTKAIIPVSVPEEPAAIPETKTTPVAVDDSKVKSQDVVHRQSVDSTTDSTKKSLSKPNSIVLPVSDSPRSQEMKTTEESWALATAGLRRPSDFGVLPGLGIIQPPPPASPPPKTRAKKAAKKSKADALVLENGNGGPHHRGSKMTLHSNGDSQASKRIPQTMAPGQRVIHSCVCSIS